MSYKLFLVFYLFLGHLIKAPIFAQQELWVPIGPWGGDVKALTVDPNQPDILYAGISRNLLKSFNRGTSWEQISNFSDFDRIPRAALINEIKINPINSQNVIITTQSSVLVSFNGGTSWQVVEDSLGFSFIDVEFNSLNPNTVYVSSIDFTSGDIVDGGGIFKSYDSGKTWRLLDNDLKGNNVSDLAIHPLDTTVVYAAVIKGFGNPLIPDVYKSTDAGENWISLNAGSPAIMENPTDFSPFSISISQKRPDTLYVGMKDSVLFSLDGGQTWLNRTGNLPQTADMRIIANDPENPNRVYAALTQQLPFRGVGLYKTEDVGLNWQRLTNGLQDSLINDIAFDPTNFNIVYVATKVFGVYSSDDAGEEWSFSHGNMNFLNSFFAVDPNNLNVIYSGDEGGIFKTEEGGSNWNRVSDITRHSWWKILVAPSDSRVVYAAGQRTHWKILRSTDSGNSWVDLGQPFEDVILDFKIDPFQANVVYASSFSGIYKSSDSAETWMPKNSGLSQLQTDALAINPLNSSTLYAGTRAGVFKSIDTAETWFEIAVDSFRVESLQIPVADTNMVLALSEGTLMRSLDGGKVWDIVNSPGNGEITGFAVEPLNPTTIWVSYRPTGTFMSRIFKTEDNGVTWQEFNAGLENIDVDKPAPYPSPDANILYLATFGRGIYKLDLVVSVEAPPKRIESFRLLQNYPNPFNPTTTVEYELPVETRIELTVYNLLGKEVIKLVNEKQPPGRYRVLWQGKDVAGKDVAAGIYLLQLKTDHFTRVTRMLLLR